MTAIASGPLFAATPPVLRLVPDAGTSRAPKSPSVLSGRERDVLSLMADGLSTREVAGRLMYSERTIKNILENVTSRLHMRNRTHAVAHAVRNGWI